MASDGISATVKGIPDLREALLSIPGKLRKRALRNALAAGARVVRDEARRNAPVLDAADRSSRRKPGTMRDAILVRTSKDAAQKGDVGVFVNVKPAKGAKFKTVSTRGAFGGTKKSKVMTRASKRGADSPDDPYYWRWVEFGHKIVARFKGKYTDYKIRGRGRLTGLSKRRRESTGFVAPKPFLVPAGKKLGESLEIFLAKIIPQINRLNGGKDVQL